MADAATSDPSTEENIEREISGIPNETRKHVMERDDGRCQVTGLRPVEIHHIIKRSQGGSSEPYNLVCVTPDVHRRIHRGELTIKDFEPGRSLDLVDADENPVESWLDERSTIEDQSEEAYDAHRRLKDLRDVAERTFVQQGKVIYEIYENEYWKTMGASSMREYLADPDLSIEYKVAMRRRRVVERLVVHHEIDEKLVVDAGIRRADEVARLWEDKETEELEELLLGAAGQSQSDVQDTVDEESEDEDESATPEWSKVLQSKVNSVRETPNSVEAWEDFASFVEDCMDRARRNDLPEKGV